MKKVLVLTAGVLLMGANLYAGNGDLVVNGNITMSAGRTIDGRDPSVDGAKLNTYPGSGAPADGTVTQAKLANYGAGSCLVIASDIGSSNSSGSYVKVKEIKVVRNGVLTVSFTQSVGYARIYKNGTAVGTDRLGAGTYSENISVNVNDLVQIYARAVFGPVTVSNFRLYSNNCVTELVTLE